MTKPIRKNAEWAAWLAEAHRKHGKLSRRIEALEQALAQYESVARRYLEIGEHMNFRRDLENARNAARAALAQTGGNL